VPEIGFPGLQPGDRWCLCAARAGMRRSMPVSHLAWRPRATHENALEYVSFEELKKRALDVA
jgi:uncharacterized protein